MEGSVVQKKRKFYFFTKMFAYFNNILNSELRHSCNLCQGLSNCSSCIILWLNMKRTNTMVQIIQKLCLQPCNECLSPLVSRKAEHFASNKRLLKLEFQDMVLAQKNYCWHLESWESEYLQCNTWCLKGNNTHSIINGAWNHPTNNAHLETGKTSKIISIYMTGGENGEKLKRKDETNILFTESQLLF